MTRGLVTRVLVKLTHTDYWFRVWILCSRVHCRKFANGVIPWDLFWDNAFDDGEPFSLGIDLDGEEDSCDIPRPIRRRDVLMYDAHVQTGPFYVIYYILSSGGTSLLYDTVTCQNPMLFHTLES
jgi:hypothetical protein